MLSRPHLPVCLNAYKTAAACLQVMDRVALTHTAAANMPPATLPTKVSLVKAHDKLLLLTLSDLLVHHVVSAWECMDLCCTNCLCLLKCCIGLIIDNMYTVHYCVFKLRSLASLIAAKQYQECYL